MFVQVEGNQAKLCWQASPSENISGYFIYKAEQPTFKYKKISSLISGLCYTNTFNFQSGSHVGGRIFAVTAINDQGKESGFSNFVWVPDIILPFDIAVTPSNHRFLVDGHTESLIELNHENQYNQHIGSPHLGLDNIRFLDIDIFDRILMSRKNHTIKVLDLEGNPEFEFGENGSGNGQFNTPAGIVFWGKNCKSPPCPPRILVVDSGNHRIQAFDQGGNFITSYGSFGSNSGQFKNPQGVTVDGSGDVIVADTSNNRLQILNFDGDKFTFIKNLTQAFNQPRDVAVGVASDGTNLIIVSDTSNHLIKMIDYSGQLWRQYNGPNSDYFGPFNSPRGIAIANGDIIVADTGNRRVVTISNALNIDFTYLPIISNSQ